MQIGFLGVGKMGSRMILKLIAGGVDVLAWNRSLEAIELLKSECGDFAALSVGSSIKRGTLTSAPTIEGLMKSLSAPRIVWLMLTAGVATESVLQELAKFAIPVDIVVDGGNSNFKDTERRFRNFSAAGVRYLGIGVSGGVHAIENGYPLMVGGDESAYNEIKQFLDILGQPRGGHSYFGTGGAGHFVKMVHNGIEYGMMQAIGEGFGVLDKSTYSFDLLKVSQLWQRSTIVSGFLLDRTKDALEKDNKLTTIDGTIAASGEGEWTVQQAKDTGVPIENISQALQFRQKSQTDEIVRNSFAAKMVSALRHEFGGHEVKKKI